MAIKAVVSNIDLKTNYATVEFTNHSSFTEDQLKAMEVDFSDDEKALEVINKLRKFKKNIKVPYTDGKFDRNEMLKRIEDHKNALIHKTANLEETLKLKAEIVPDLDGIENMEFALPSREEEAAIEAFGEFAKDAMNAGAISENENLGEPILEPEEPVPEPETPALAKRPNVKKKKKNKNRRRR